VTKAELFEPTTPVAAGWSTMIAGSGDRESYNRQPCPAATVLVGSEKFPKRRISRTSEKPMPCVEKVVICR
jgi:hypothetical protein